MLDTEKYEIFISYLRSDVHGWAALLYQRLNDRLRPHGWRAFKDEEEISAGQRDWPDRLRRLVQRCEIFIVVIGEEWHQDSIALRLANEDNWVRKEILYALRRADKQPVIIPLCVGGVGVPDASRLPPEIQSLLSSNAAVLSNNTSRWDSEIEALYEWPGQAASAQRRGGSYLLAQLDRHKEASCVAEVRKQDDRALAVTSGQQDGYKYFAYRCAQELPGLDDDQHMREPISILWREFAARITAEQRQAVLYREIAKHFGLDKADDVSSALREHFADSRQPLVIYTFAAGKIDAERVQEWLRYCSELLAGDTTQENVIAILFVDRSWFVTRRLASICSAGSVRQQLLQHGLQKIVREDVDEFIKLITDDELKPEANQLVARCFRWPWHKRGVRFTSIVSTLKPVIPSSY